MTLGGHCALGLWLAPGLWLAQDLWLAPCLLSQCDHGSGATMSDVCCIPDGYRLAADPKAGENNSNSIRREPLRILLNGTLLRCLRA